jgi:hypothetical protein
MSNAKKNARCGICKRDFLNDAEAKVHYESEIHRIYAFSFAYQGKLSSRLFPQILEANEVSRNLNKKRSPR